MLHAGIMNEDATKIREASIAADKPMAIVFPVNTSPELTTGAAVDKVKNLIKACGLWFSDE